MNETFTNLTLLSYLVGGIVAVALLIAQGAVIWFLWAWFAAPLGAPVLLNWWHAFGLILLARIVSSPLSIETKQHPELNIQIGKLVTYAGLLGIGWGVAGMMP